MTKFKISLSSFRFPWDADAEAIAGALAGLESKKSTHNDFPLFRLFL